MNHDAPEGWPRGGEWNWLWEAYVVGLAVAAIVAVVLLDHRYPGNVIGAAIALSAMAAVVLVFGRHVTRLPERDWRTFAFVGAVIGLWVAALIASPVAVAAVPAIYPVVFSTLPLRTALVVTTIVTVVPLTLLLLSQGIRSPNLPMAVAIHPHRCDRGAGDRHRDQHVDGATPTAGGAGRGAGGHPRRERSPVP